MTDEAKEAAARLAAEFGERSIEYGADEVGSGVVQIPRGLRHMESDAERDEYLERLPPASITIGSSVPQRMVAHLLNGFGIPDEHWPMRVRGYTVADPLRMLCRCGATPLGNEWFDHWRDAGVLPPVTTE